ncbi:hypothetical protein Tco_1055292 [Tanacetum coccineum]|uniref:Uncharacterized protein n=1 Tax=Tanacetum coccineum TaxID=301880 RepID=A0ABQ5GZY5_9ASTR
MRFNEIYKFSDGTLTRILEALDYRVKEFKATEDEKDLLESGMLCWWTCSRILTTDFFGEQNDIIIPIKSYKDGKVRYYVPMIPPKPEWIFNSLVHSLRALSTLRRSGLRTASAAAKPCQGDSLEFYLITGRIPDDRRFQGYTLSYNTSLLDDMKYSSLALEDQSLDHLETRLYDLKFKGKKGKKGKYKLI